MNTSKITINYLLLKRKHSYYHLFSVIFVYPAPKTAAARGLNRTSAARRTAPPPLAEPHLRRSFNRTCAGVKTAEKLLSLNLNRGLEACPKQTGFV